MKTVGSILFIISCCATVLGGIAIRIMNMDMTETRLFFEYWWFWCLAFVALFITGYLAFGIDE